MKKKYLALAVMCMALTISACTESADTDTKTGDSAETSGKSEKTSESRKSGESTRIVTVKDVEDYVKIAEYKGIEVEDQIQEVTEELLEEEVAYLMSSRTEIMNDSDAAVQEGDLVTISYVGTIDGKVFEGGTANNYDLTVGDSDMVEGFEEGILGMKLGETRDVFCTFPGDYHSTETAGKEAVFRVTLQTIRRSPELTKKWVKQNTDFTTIEEYKESVKADMEKSMEEYAESNMKNEAWQILLINSEVTEYPEKDIENARAQYEAQIALYAEQSNMELEAFIESQGITMEAYEEQARQYAEAKVKQNLIVQGIMDAEGITLEDEECLAIQDMLIETYDVDSLADLVDKYGQDLIDESIALLRVEDVIYDNLIVIQPVTDVPVEETSTEEESAEETPTEETSAEEESAEEIPTEETPAEEESAEEESAGDASEGVPGEEAPTEETSAGEPVEE